MHNSSMESPEKEIPGPEMGPKTYNMAGTPVIEQKEARIIKNKKQRLSDLFTIVRACLPKLTYICSFAPDLP
jgi:hypothetical protein